MNDEEFKVKDLIKYLADFNPNAKIMNKINPSWYCEYDGGTKEQSKLDTDKVWLYEEDKENE